MKDEIRVYLIARISEEAHAWNEKVTFHLRPPVQVFLPHQHNPYNLEHRKIPLSVVETDIKAMEESDIGLALPEFGNDCSFETGWYAHSSKPLAIFVDTQLEWLRDWMIKGGLDYVITSNPQTLQTLKEDEILQHKSILFIPSLSELTAAILQIYRAHSDRQR